ncbi:helix-turn-helix domain-containing protein [Lactiplantibacillus garii]|uniref:Helix-turn-helix domain-containing protein n=1 Tax=Lactiplantibacillus garii TaxID=2306423 RepID=A0A3R8LJ51_9LACO|nr:helix-turn-helix domain-containing protein [Lactiplantibacillus garii]RRK09878.1 helix-turn-helix domain-containing protein [Lactiplantibacillus garii]
MRIVKNVKHLNKTTHKMECFNVIIVDESVKIATESFVNQHEYWVPKGEPIDDEENWLEPIDFPDKNLIADYAQYRKKYHFLTPDEIKKQRRALNLNLREASAIVGISYSTLSDIERGLRLQSLIQDNLLRYFGSAFSLAALVDQHYTLIEEKLDRSHLNIDGLVKKLARAREKETAPRPLAELKTRHS